MKIVLATLIVVFIVVAFYFAFLKVGFDVWKAKASIASKKGLVLELKFDNIDEYTYDSSGKNNQVNISAMKVYGQACFSGGCLSIDGLNDSVEIQPLGLLEDLTDDGKSWAFSLMFKPSGLPRQGKPGYILFRQGWHGGLYYNLQGVYGGTLWLTNDTNKTQPNKAIGLGSGGLKLEVVKWYHLAMVLDGEKKEAKLYLDGKQVGSTLNLSTGLPMKDYGKARYYVGGAAGAYDAYGMFDNVRIYDRVLSDEEVSVLARWHS